MTALVLDIIIVIDRGREAKRPLSSLFSSSPPLSPNINRPRDKRRPGTLLYRVERLPFYLIFFFLFPFSFSPITRVDGWKVSLSHRVWI